VAVDNPTFSESWYRVAELRPRLRATARVHRQSFRGRIWYVIRDPAGEDFFRLHEAAYYFVGLLDGRRTVSQAWRICNDRLGDEALTQPEVVQVLGQLYVANLLQARLPPDAEGLFQRYRKRVRRELSGTLGNLLFLRIPLFDPDRLLDKLVVLARPVFTVWGFGLWLALVVAGVVLVLAHRAELTSQAYRLLDAANLAGNLPLLYACFVAAKLAHEFGHALACKKFGLQTHTGGEVHTMGVMLLVLAPMPYVDASSTWALRSKLHRVVAAAAGMMTELALAAIAAAVWVLTAGRADASSQLAHAVAYNVMFVAGIATLLFNGNPLLRFDGYYILSDLLEIPNLDGRSRQYLYYLVKRYAWGLRKAANPADSPGEAAWLAGYGIASTAFRVFICVKIVLMLIGRFLLIGAVLAVTAAVAWVLVPLGRFVHYLLAGPELLRNRGRALATTLAVLAALMAALGFVRLPDRCCLEAVAEPARMAYIHAGGAGFVQEVVPSGREVRGPLGGRAGEVLVRLRDRDLECRLAELVHERRLVVCRINAARETAARDKSYLALVQILQADLAELDRQVEMLRAELEGLSVRAPLGGVWISRRAEELEGLFVRRGDRLGMVACLEEMVLRSAPSQRVAGMLMAEAARGVEVRLLDRPEVRLRGTWRLLPAEEPASSWPPGGPGAEGVGGPGLERRFGIRVSLPGRAGSVLLPGQRAVVRFELTAKPLARQWWRSFRQLVQRRFGL